jgi:queuine tRNA-ribosyltransferase
MELKDFSVSHVDGKARAGILKTSRGCIETPVFMPVGTAATVKAMTPESLEKLGAQILLCNTYHLMVRPGEEIVNQLGGLNEFMNWSGPILTDSGGFQVMSLSKLRKLDENGVTFRSHIDGKKFLLTPESSIKIQERLQSTIIMSFDECTPFPVEKEIAEKSMSLSLRWGERSKSSFSGLNGSMLFGIQQGGMFRELREHSAVGLKKIGFDGYAIGGLAVGEPQEKMFEVLDYSVDFFPKDRPRYLMGVGKPSDIVGAVLRGVDMFDCVIPTRSGRNGQAFVETGIINLKNAKYKIDKTPIDEHCNCYSCLNYSRGYLRHLIRSNEILGSMLLTWHNLHYYLNLMKKIRESIKKGGFTAFAHNFLARSLNKNNEVH